MHPEPPTQQAKPAEREANCAHHRPVRLCWAKLLKRASGIDLAHYPNGGGERKIIAATCGAGLDVKGPEDRLPASI